LPREYQIQAFSNEVINMIAGEFREYFKRKKRGGLSIREAATLVDYVNGPKPRRSSAKDVTQTRVTGGGLHRPTAEDVEAIYLRHGQGQDGSEWDIVFDEVLNSYRSCRENETLILLCFRDNHSDFVISDELRISISTYYRYRRHILERSAVIAVKYGLLEP